MKCDLPDATSQELKLWANTTVPSVCGARRGNQHYAHAPSSSCFKHLLPVSPVQRTLRGRYEADESKVRKTHKIGHPLNKFQIHNANFVGPFGVLNFPFLLIGWLEWICRNVIYVRTPLREPCILHTTWQSERLLTFLGRTPLTMEMAFEIIYYCPLSLVLAFYPPFSCLC